MNDKPVDNIYFLCDRLYSNKNLKHLNKVPSIFETLFCSCCNFHSEHIDTLGFLNIEIWIDDNNKKFYSLEYNNINDEKFYINMTSGLLQKDITYFSGII